MINSNNNYSNTFSPQRLDVLMYPFQQSNFSTEVTQNKENIPHSSTSTALIAGECLKGSFLPIHQALPGISVIPSTWGDRLPVKGQDRAFKTGSKLNFIFMGVLDGVSGKQDTSKSELAAQYFAEGICKAIDQSQDGNFKDVIYKGYRTACITASKDRDLFPEFSENNAISRGASTTFSLVRLSPTPMEEGEHEGKYLAKIFVLGDSGVAVCNRSKGVTGFLIGSNEKTTPGQVYLRYAKFSSNPSTFHSFNQECEERYPGDNIKLVRKYNESYLDHGDLVIAASDGLWDNLKPEDVHEIIKDLQFAYPREYLKNTLPYAYIIAEIANFISKQSFRNMNFGGKPDDISVVVSIAGINGDVIVKSAVMEKYSHFISEQCGIYFTKYGKKFVNKQSLPVNTENLPTSSINRSISPILAGNFLEENNMKNVELLLQAATLLDEPKTGSDLTTLFPKSLHTAPSLDNKNPKKRKITLKKKRLVKT